MMRWPSRSPVVLLRVGVFATLVLLAYFFLSRHDVRHDVIYDIRHDDTPAVSSIPSSHSPADFCLSLPPRDNVVIAVKTGATEAADKLPGQMQTMLRCAKNVFIFSDLEQDIGTYHLYDSLDNVSTTLVESNIDFKFYQQQSQMWRDKHSIDGVKGAKNPEKPTDLAAWTLDKYKNIHIVEKTWALKPDMDWYLFIDADTYVLWPNMLRWLAGMNPNKKYYSGSEVSISGTRFAHGGSGIIMSKAAVSQITVKHKGTAGRWDSKTKEHCCGDLMLGKALKEYGIDFQDSWPSVSGETPATMPFGPGTPEYWCRPALTMHHLTLTDMKDLADYEAQRKNQGPLTHAELFQDYIMKSMVSQRKDWDNLAADPGEFSKTGGVLVEATAFSDCIIACEEKPECFQYSHHGSKCYIGMSVRLGYEKKSDAEGIWQSGWNTTRLASWAAKQPKCNQIEFPKQT